ncbi:MAG: hypothetical protein K6G26_06780 [Lachnospiraceae bacterium]|nr:hypothetical protein [Lachnospiraceae bacterium]
MFKLAISYITKMKKNTIICLSGIVVSVIMIFSLVQISITIKNSFNNVMLSNSNYDLMYMKVYQ